MCSNLLSSIGIIYFSCLIGPTRLCAINTAVGKLLIKLIYYNVFCFILFAGLKCRYSVFYAKLVSEGNSTWARRTPCWISRISDHAVTKLFHNFHVVKVNLWSPLKDPSGPWSVWDKSVCFLFRFSCCSFWRGKFKTVLNTQEEDLTMDIAPIIIFSGQLGLSLTSQWYISNVRS